LLIESGTALYGNGFVQGYPEPYSVLVKACFLMRAEMIIKGMAAWSWRRLALGLRLGSLRRRTRCTNSLSRL
jgi:hypothetical protein